MMEKSRNRAVGRQVRKMIAAAMAAMLVFTSANVADVNAEETVLAVSENAVTGETGAGVVEAKKTGEQEVENGGAENREAENTDLDAETADPAAEVHTNQYHVLILRCLLHLSLLPILLLQELGQLHGLHPELLYTFVLLHVNKSC